MSLTDGSRENPLVQNANHIDLKGLYQSLKDRIKQKDIGFTGFGLIVSQSPASRESLPLSPLTKENTIVQLTSSELTGYLLKLSLATDVRHDGFHIFYPLQSLLKTAQYVAPSLPDNSCSLVFDVGARIRTAQLASMYNGIQEVLCVGANKQAVLAKNGQLQELFNE